MQYSNLSKDQKDFLKKIGIINGCGPSNWRGNGPQFFFKANCDEHDFNYEKGGTEMDRRWYDKGFYVAMVKDSKKLPWYKAIYARTIAWMFYRLIRWRGDKNGRFKFRSSPLENYEQMISEYD